MSKKSRKRNKRALSASIDAAEQQELCEQAGERTVPKGEAPVGSGFSKTEAQRRHEAKLRQKEAHLVEHYASKSHQQKARTRFGCSIPINEKTLLTTSCLSFTAGERVQRAPRIAD